MRPDPRPGTRSRPDMHTDARTATRVRLLHAIFEQQARVRPDVHAIDIPPAGPGGTRVQWSYARLDAAAEALAARLAPWIPGESVVAIVTPRAGLELFTAQLAIMKAGAAWTCIEPDTPRERLRFLLEDSRAVAVVAGPAERQAVIEAGYPAERIVDPDVHPHGPDVRRTAPARLPPAH